MLQVTTVSSLTTQECCIIPREKAILENCIQTEISQKYLLIHFSCVPTSPWSQWDFRLCPWSWKKCFWVSPKQWDRLYRSKESKRPKLQKYAGTWLFQAVVKKYHETSESLVSYYVFKMFPHAFLQKNLLYYFPWQCHNILRTVLLYLKCQNMLNTI